MNGDIYGHALGQLQTHVVGQTPAPQVCPTCQHCPTCGRHVPYTFTPVWGGSGWGTGTVTAAPTPNITYSTPTGPVAEALN